MVLVSQVVLVMPERVGRYLGMFMVLKSFHCREGPLGLKVDLISKICGDFLAAKTIVPESRNMFPESAWASNSSGSEASELRGGT